VTRSMPGRLCGSPSTKRTACASVHRPRRPASKDELSLSTPGWKLRAVQAIRRHARKCTLLPAGHDRVALRTGHERFPVSGERGCQVAITTRNPGELQELPGLVVGVDDHVSRRHPGFDRRKGVVLGDAVGGNDTPRTPMHRPTNCAPVRRCLPKYGLFGVFGWAAGGSGYPAEQRNRQAAQRRRCLRRRQAQPSPNIRGTFLRGTPDRPSPTPGGEREPRQHQQCAHRLRGRTSWRPHVKYDAAVAVAALAGGAACAARVAAGTTAAATAVAGTADDDVHCCGSAAAGAAASE
jgi:hypothetical protein